ncbi:MULTISPECIES: monovalent cation/H+ antiporter complex subunit F [Nocardioides]|uniref:Monovalent cation/H+ antiporter complex subunit F n=1 Tax=Nocardioides kribbensis TaxID=305517 RepID=A0ABV1NW86_9ACTN|nr:MULTISPECIES: monovalent cation/H+ antiporter complex subunit F [Nocardioides]MCM3515048.1 monovalent cation/H+ antiporter complex subunit F [Nocardioides sp. P86]
MSPSDLVTTACVVMLGLAAVLLVVRITRGPTVLDRTVALDVLVAVVICAIAVDAVERDTSTTLPVLLVLTLVGFVGSVAVARFAKGSDDVDAESGDEAEGGRL